MTVPGVRRALQLLPTCATTGIGSLPHTQLELGLQMALQVDLPFLPQFPAQVPSELMIPSALEGLPGLAFDPEGMCTVDLAAWRSSKDGFEQRLQAALGGSGLETFEPSPQACRAWKPFLWEVEHRKLAFAKIQIAGPATVRWVARTSEGQPASEQVELDQQIFRLVLAKALAMVKALRKANTTPILFLDEPGLYALDIRNPRHLVVLQELKVLILTLQREGALVGLHCCSNTHWPSIFDLGLDIVSLDVRLSLDAALEDPMVFLRHLMSGATLSLGIIPTDLLSEFQVRDLVESVEAALRATLPRDSALPEVLGRMLLTPACGLGMRSVSDAEAIFGMVREAQTALKTLTAPAAPRETSEEPPAPSLH
jgi:hypothetical protein